MIGTGKKRHRAKGTPDARTVDTNPKGIPAREKPSESDAAAALRARFGERRLAPSFRGPSAEHISEVPAWLHRLFEGPQDFYVAYTIGDRLSSRLYMARLTMSPGVHMWENVREMLAALNGHGADPHAYELFHVKDMRVAPEKPPL